MRSFPKWRCAANRSDEDQRPVFGCVRKGHWIGSKLFMFGVICLLRVEAEIQDYSMVPGRGHVISTNVGADPCVCPDLGIVIKKGAHVGRCRETLRLNLVIAVKHL